MEHLEGSYSVAVAISDMANIIKGRQMFRTKGPQI